MLGVSNVFVGLWNILCMFSFDSGSFLSYWHQVTKGTPPQKKKIDCLFSSSSTSLMKNFLPLLLWGGEQLLWSKRPASLFLLPDKLTVSSGKSLNSAQVFVCQFEGLKQYKEVRGPYPDKRRLGLFKLWGFFLQISWILPNTSVNNLTIFDSPLQ